MASPIENTLTIRRLDTAKTALKNKLNELTGLPEEERDQKMENRLQVMMSRFEKAKNTINKYYSSKGKKKGLSLETLTVNKIKGKLNTEANVKGGYGVMDALEDKRGFAVAALGTTAAVSVLKAIPATVSFTEGGLLGEGFQATNVLEVVGGWLAKNPAVMLAIATTGAAIAIAKMPQIRRAWNQSKINRLKIQEAENEIHEAVLATDEQTLITRKILSGNTLSRNELDFLRTNRSYCQNLEAQLSKPNLTIKEKKAIATAFNAIGYSTPAMAAIAPDAKSVAASYNLKDAMTNNHVVKDYVAATQRLYEIEHNEHFENIRNATYKTYTTAIPTGLTAKREEKKFITDFNAAVAEAESDNTSALYIAENHRDTILNNAMTDTSVNAANFSETKLTSAMSAEADLSDADKYWCVPIINDLKEKILKDPDAFDPNTSTDYDKDTYKSVWNRITKKGTSTKLYSSSPTYFNEALKSLKALHIQLRTNGYAAAKANVETEKKAIFISVKDKTLGITDYNTAKTNATPVIEGIMSAAGYTGPDIGTEAAKRMQEIERKKKEAVKAKDAGREIDIDI